MSGGYWYLMSPYSGYPHGRAAAFELARETTALLMCGGIPVFSPIAHGHVINEWYRRSSGGGDLHEGEDPHGFWMRMDLPMLRAAKGCILLLANGWHESEGIRAEIAEANRLGKPVVEMRPGFVPAELREVVRSDQSRTGEPECAPRRSVLDEARDLVNGDRQDYYGAPEDNLGAIARLWSVLLDRDVTAEDVARCMIALKLARDCTRPKRDNAVDAAGYAELLERVRQA